jgi:hypothetical protein
MTVRIKTALRRRLAGSALGGLIALGAIPAAVAQWLPPWRVAVPYGAIEQRLEAQGYVLIAPLQRRPGIYLADVRAGPAGYQRLVIDDRSGDILERFIVPPRSFGPQFAVRYGELAEPSPPGILGPQPGPGFSVTPSGGPAAKSANGGPANVRIPSAVSPFGSQAEPTLAPPKPKSPATASKTPPAKTAPATAAPPLPPPAPPREAAKPDESAPPAPKPEPKIDSSPGEIDNASTANPPAASEPKPEAAKIDPQPEAQTQATSPSDAPASAADLSDKSRVSIVPAALFE